MRIVSRFLAIAVLVPVGITASSYAWAQTDMMSTILEKLTARVQKFENSCGDDIKKFCTGVTPGGGHLISCMQAYEDKISAKCAYELDEVELDLQATNDQLKEIMACLPRRHRKIVWRYKAWRRSHFGMPSVQ